MERIVNKLAKLLVNLSSIWLFAIMFLVGADVFLRYTINMPISGTLEISEQTVVIITFLCFAYTGIINRHIKTTAIVRRLPSSLAYYSEVFSSFMMQAMLTLLIWQSGKEAWYAVCLQETRMGLIEVPIYPTKIAVPVGLSIAWLYYFLEFIAFFRREGKTK